MLLVIYDIMMTDKIITLYLDQYQKIDHYLYIHHLQLDDPNLIHLSDVS